MKKLKLTSEIPPSVNHYLAYRAVIKNGKPHAFSYNTPESIQYKNKFSEYVKNEIEKQGWDIKPNKWQHFYVDAVFYFNKIDMDCNNYFKVMLDAITDTQAIWPDDNVVCERVQRIYYDSQNPRIELSIYPVDYIGIFDNVSQLDNFESNCIGCARYSKNCSILNKAKIGRIQPDICDGECTKYKEKKSVDKGRETETY